MANDSRVEQLSREELIALVLELQRQMAVLLEENARLKRSGRRQAAPFSKEKPVPNPKKAGRKKGQGPFGRRTAPAGDAKTKVDAKPPPCCPFCGGPLEEDDVEFATTTDVPEQPQPEVTQYRVAVCHCRDGGKKVRGTAPGLAADQYGATAHRVGPSVMAAAHALPYGVGVPQRKVPGVLKELTGVTITQSAIAQDALRRAAREVGAECEQLRQAVRQASFVHTDDTGWRVGGKTAFLMGFETDRAAVYQIRSQHRNEEVREIIPSDFGGVMITDRGKSYDAGEFDAVEQQKCLGHILRNITEVLETKQGRARDSLSPEVFAANANELREMLSYHLRDRILKDRDNQRLLNGLGQQDDCGRLLRCLSPPFVEPTNDRAERMLRPAVIARKVSHCSKNQAGADAFAAFTSLAQTTVKNGNTSVTAAFRSLFYASMISPVETMPVGR